METNFNNRLQATMLAVATVGLVLLAVLNFRQESRFEQPADGVWWSETRGGLEASKVLPDSPGQLAGIRAGDVLTEVNDAEIVHMSDLQRALYRAGVYTKANYSITRGGIALDTPVVVIPEPPDRSLAQALRVIGLIYLAIGIYVLFRRWTAPHATHFYLFCLVAFALYALKYTGALDTLDTSVFWGNVIAESLQPALFLHFALSFPEERLRKFGRRWLLPLVYAPGIALLGLWLWAINFWEATEILRHRMDQAGVAYDTAYYLLAAGLFLRSYSQAGTPLLRQQLKWLTRCALLAVLPFTFLNAIPFLFDLHVPVMLTRVAGLSLVFLPLTFSWAIVRYRLMDTDLIFKRGVAYTLATGLILGAYFGVIALIAEVVHQRLPETMREWALILAILVTAAIFDPLKRRIQSWVDRVFDRHRYDYRKALVEFGRGLSSETDLKALLESIVERLPRTLLVVRVAVFLAEDSGTLRLVAAHGLPPEARTAQGLQSYGSLALGFLNFDQDNAHSHIFLENAQQALHLPEDERRTAAMLDLNYYLPCRVAGGQSQDGTSSSRTIAVIGLGRTIGGDFLSSEDVELLESLASYIGIALQNASLYARLENKISEFERLKEFNENIVESINVGILAVGLDDSIESWNAQMEAMYALSRAEALSQPLSTVFPAEFIEALEGFRNEAGVHHLYKFRLTTRAGEQRTANIAIAPLLSRDFVPMGRIILVDDITERVSLEAQLAQADKLSSIGLLAAGVAHEINTPLAVISSYAQMLAKQISGDEQKFKLLDKIAKQTFRASEIVNSLLSFSRTSPTEFVEVDLNKVIRETLTLIEHQLEKASIEVKLTLESGLPGVKANSGKLQQVFLNLFLNARDAMETGGTLAIRTWNEDGFARIEVADSGQGIPPEHLERIYDPFFTTKGSRKGTGLGLSVTYGIVREHGGAIRVESRPGAGARFHVELPLARKRVD